jgi:hypothetical protein
MLLEKTNVRGGASTATTKLPEIELEDLPESADYSDFIS